MVPSQPAAKKNVRRVPRSCSMRAVLITTMADVLAGQSLMEKLPEAMSSLAERDRSLFHELLYGSLRQQQLIFSTINPMLKKMPTDHHLVAALLVGVYQLQFTRVAEHAAIGETVEALKQLGKKSACGLVNAILRRVQREVAPSQLLLQSQKTPMIPNWLQRRLQGDWPQFLPQLAQQLLQPAPMALRVNARQSNRDTYLQRLHEQQLVAHASSLSDDGIVMAQSTGVHSLPDFALGHVSVQDEHAQLACTLLGDVSGQLVLDVCAAPGGKTAHILEKYAPKKLYALDISAERLARVTDNLERLLLMDAECSLVASDALIWQPAELFDTILLDAPCSASGVIRRHPDILLLRDEQDIERVVALQRQLLNRVWSWLKPGGILLYVTCSLFKSENEQQIAAFLERTADAAELPITASWGLACQVGRQCLPLNSGQGDGFYFARLKKVASYPT